MDDKSKDIHNPDSSAWVCDGCGETFAGEEWHVKDGKDGYFCFECVKNPEVAPWPYFTMEIKSQDEWRCIAKAVNQGIDARLEAITERSMLDHATGKCAIHPEEIGCLIRRLKQDDDPDARQLGEDIEMVKQQFGE
jgi:hypothetical protein